MRRTWVLSAVLVTLAAGCSYTGTGHGSSPSPPPITESPSPVGSTPSGTPSPASSLSSGSATVNVSGELTASATLARLVLPAAWAPPPAPMELTWGGGGGQELSLAGTSFLSRQETSPDRALTFTVNGPDGPVVFGSTAGECDVTITPALPEEMGGVFMCTALTDASGGTTVDARGTFSASG